MVYDVAYAHVPECYTWRNRAYIDFFLKLGLSRADAVVTISENAKSDIVERYRVEPSKVHIIYGAVDSSFKRITDADIVAGVKRKFGISRDFILNVSLITPRKNGIRLIQAYASLRKRGIFDGQLVFVGARGWLSDNVFRAASRSGYSQDIIFCNYVMHDELLCLYSGALVFAYPSLYEGFGLPILEAFACGCPVLTSSVSSMPEVSGDGALTVDPYSSDSIAAGLERIITDANVRDDLVSNGTLRLSNFSWDRSARSMVGIYDLLLKR
jgi:glycosyltransferase involved in cell wall biosynthesis